MNYEYLLQRLTDRQKAEFLERLLRERPDVREDFEFAFRELPFEPADWEAKPISHYLDWLAKQKKEIFQELEELDLDDIDYDDYRDSGHYVPQYEIEEELAREIVEDCVDGIFDAALRMVDQGEAGEGTLLVLALWMGIQDASFESGGDYLGDPENAFLEAFTERLPNAEKFILNAVKTDSGRILLSKLLVLGIVEADVKGDVFEQLLSKLSEEAKVAQDLLPYCKEVGLEAAMMPRYWLALLWAAGDHKQWVEAATQLWKGNLEIAERLLGYYASQDRTTFAKMAADAFAHFGNQISEWLCAHLQPEKELVLWKEVMSFQSIRQSDIAHYQRLREFLDDSEKIAYLEAMPDHSHLFKMQIHAMEGQKNLILTFLKQNLDSYSFDAILALVASDFPDERYQLLRDRVFHMVANRRGRDYYVQIAGYLKQMRAIPNRAADAMNVILQVYGHKPSLPALKEELRKAGLVS